MQIVSRFEDDGRQEDQKEGGGREHFLSLPVRNVSLGQHIDEHSNEGTQNDNNDGLGQVLESSLQHQVDEEDSTGDYAQDEEDAHGTVVLSLHGPLVREICTLLRSVGDG